MNGKLYRDAREGALSGVCAGLGTYFGIDKTLVRVFFVLSVLFASVLGVGVLGPVLYVVLWIVLPEKPVSLSAPAGPVRRGTSYETSRFEVDYRVSGDTYTASSAQKGAPDSWQEQGSQPAFGQGRSRPADRTVAGLVLIGVGVVFLLHQLEILDWQKVIRFWPVLLIVGGIVILVGGIQGLNSRRPSSNTPSNQSNPS